MVIRVYGIGRRPAMQAQEFQKSAGLERHLGIDFLEPREVNRGPFAE
jgi:hypothetical protein